MASVSLEGLNLARVHPGTSITASVTASSLASSSPPSGHSTPKLTPRSPAREMDRMGVMTLVRFVQRTFAPVRNNDALAEILELSLKAFCVSYSFSFFPNDATW